MVVTPFWFSYISLMAVFQVNLGQPVFPLIVFCQLSWREHLSMNGSFFSFVSVRKVLQGILKLWNMDSILELPVGVINVDLLISDKGHHAFDPAFQHWCHFSHTSWQNFRIVTFKMSTKCRWGIKILCTTNLILQSAPKNPSLLWSTISLVIFGAKI